MMTMPTSPTPTPPELEAVAGRVRDRLSAVLDLETKRWRAVDANLAQPLSSITRLVLSGGKRLRPAFCYWAFVGTGGDPDDTLVIDVGAAFELLHAFALMHDDVMDGSLTRRGLTTIHTEFAGLHREAGWRGEPRRFGEGVAILAGDLAAVLADRLLQGAPPAAWELWHELKLEVDVGQYLDLLGTVRGSTDLATAQRIARYKSGKYTVERPLQLGATLHARTSPTLHRSLAALTAYGRPVGEAFQLRDDLLGVFGDAFHVGKPVGDDLREGKPTPLVAIATERCTGSDRTLLARIGQPDLSIEEVAKLQALLDHCGARDAIELRIKQCTEEAIAALASADLASEAGEALAVLASFVADRDR